MITRLRANPIAVVLLGVLAYLAGIAVCHVPVLQPPGGTRLSAIEWDNLCSSVHQAYGGNFGETSFCHQAAAVRGAGDFLILAGIIVAVTGVVLTVRGLHRRHVQRHPASQPQKGVAR
jgi:hypothetical protein